MVVTINEETKALQGRGTILVILNSLENSVNFVGEAYVQAAVHECALMMMMIK